MLILDNVIYPAMRKEKTVQSEVRCNWLINTKCLGRKITTLCFLLKFHNKKNSIYLHKYELTCS